MKAIRVLALLTAAVSLNAQVSFKVTSLVRIGDAAPVPWELAIASSPSLSDSGQAVYVGDGGIFLASGKKQILVAAPGDPAPGGGSFSVTRFPSLTASGQVVFEGIVTSPGQSGVFSFTEKGGLTKVVAVGDPAPDGGVFTFLIGPSVSSAGQIVFGGNTTAGGGGFWLLAEGQIRHLVRFGDPMPGGGSVVGLSVPPALNAAGQLAFIAILDTQASGIFLLSDGTFTAVARTDQPPPSGGSFSSFIPPDDAVSRVPAGGFGGFVFTPAPDNFKGAADGTAIQGFPLPSLSDAGQVAFGAFLQPSGSAIFLFTEEGLSRVVRSGDPAPGGGILTSVDMPSLNAAGQISFRGFVFDGMIGYGAILLRSEGTLSEVIRSGAESPEGDIFSGFFSIAINSSPQIAFSGQLRNRLGGVYLASEGQISRVAGQGDPVDREPLFLGASPQAINSGAKVIVSGASFPGGSGLFHHTPTVIARQGDPAPGGGVFSSVGAASLSDSGQAAFSGFLSNGDSGLFLSGDGKLSSIARTGNPAPGGGNFVTFSPPSINNPGQVAFPAFATPPSTSGLFLLSEGSFTQLLRLGDPAPGGGTFQQFGFPSLNDNGDVAFLASVSPPGRPGVFLLSSGMVSAIAQDGDPAPGGGNFSFPPSPSSLLAPSLNGAGQVAFGAGLLGQPSGVFLYSDGNLSAIARPGDPAPGGIFGFADSASLDASGQVAFASGISPIGLTAVLYSEGTLSRIASPGDPAPGGGVFLATDFPKLNASGQATFVGFLVTGGSGAFLATPR